MKKVMMISSVAMVFVMFLSLNAYSQNSQKISKQNDISFPQNAYSGGMMEVELGRLAQQKASSEKVKQFGERMIADHTKANEELKAIAMKDNISLPAKMLDSNKDTYDQLNKYDGKEFDKEYMNKMVEDHKQVISDFEDASQNAKNQDVRQWAKNTLPTLRQHLELAQKTLNGLQSSK
jgi:putative membrane protein